MPKILFVDDNREFLEIVSSVLHKVGYDVITAENGIEAIGKYHESSFDAVVTDLVMPGANGYELVRHIRDTSMGAIPAVIGISGASCDINLNYFDIVLEKPFFLRKLIECLKDFEHKRK
jgi:CheY-like chemotaxis protein